MPALEAADAAVDKLESKHIAEMKSVNTPHPDVHMVMMAVMIYLGQKTEWIEIKKVIGKPTFKNDLMAFDKENIPQARLSKVQKYTRMETFQVAHMTKINVAAAALASWVKAIEEFSQALKVVIPKREKKEAAEAKVKLMEEQLAEMQEKYNQMMATLEALKAEYAIIEADMARYKRDLLTLSQQIDRGEELISGLSGEKVRWKASQIELEEDYKKLVGDCLIAASMISF
jgi:dynein heavy chain